MHIERERETFVTYRVSQRTVYNDCEVIEGIEIKMSRFNVECMNESARRKALDPPEPQDFSSVSAQPLAARTNFPAVVSCFTAYAARALFYTRALIHATLIFIV